MVKSPPSHAQTWRKQSRKEWQIQQFCVRWLRSHWGWGHYWDIGAAGWGVGGVSFFVIRKRGEIDLFETKRDLSVSIESYVKYGVRSPKFIWAPMYSCTRWLRLATSPLPPHLGSHTRALLVSQDGRRLFVIPCLVYFTYDWQYRHWPWCRIMNILLGKKERGWGGGCI